MTGFSRAEAKRKQWDSGLQRRDPDSKELTKLGLGMTEATGCVFRKHVWALFMTAGTCEAHAGNLFNNLTILTGTSIMPQVCCPLLEMDFKEEVLHFCHHYYFIISVITT